jgi:hypothetical protein
VQLGDTLTNRETGEQCEIVSAWLLMEEQGAVALYILDSGERVRGDELDEEWVRPEEAE